MATVLVDVLIVMPDGNTRTAKGAVDPSASWAEIRTAVVKALRLENPTSWVMTVEPSDGSAPVAGYTPRDGDRLYLFNRSVHTPPFQLRE